MKYRGTPNWQEGLLLRPYRHAKSADGYAWCLLTPDEEMVLESLDGQDRGPQSYVVLDSIGAAPEMLRRKFYRFKRYPRQIALEGHFLNAAKKITDMGLQVLDCAEYVDENGHVERWSLEEEPPREEAPKAATATPRHGVAGEPGKVVTASGVQVWVLVEPHANLELGSQVTFGPGDFMIGDHLALRKDGNDWLKCRLMNAADVEDEVKRIRSAAEKKDGVVAAVVSDAITGAGGQPAKKKVGSDDDVRTLWVDTDSQGARHKPWKAVVEECTEEAWRDSPHEGANTLFHLMKQMLKYGGTPRQWLTEYLRDRKIEKSDRTYHELVALIDAIEYAGCIDQINLPSLVSMERLARRIATIVDAYGNVGAPNWKMAKHYEGTAGPFDAVSPALRTWGMKRYKEEQDLLGKKGRQSSALAEEEDRGDGDEDGGHDAAGPARRRGGGRGRGGRKHP